MQPTQEKTFYNPEQLSAFDPTRVPHHIAIIPDGNRRWAKKQASSAEKGHQEGADTLIDITNAAKELGVKVVTFYTFSTENWSRPKAEVQAFLWLLEKYLREQIEAMVAQGIRLHWIGNLDGIPESLRAATLEAEQATAHCNEIELVLAINYGGRDEICRAIQKIIDTKADRNAITEELISQHLDTSPWKDPDLLIRASGEHRISNFLMWQISYSEIYISNVLWPDFTAKHLLEAVLSYQERERRLGGT